MFGKKKDTGHEDHQIDDHTVTPDVSLETTAEDPPAAEASTDETTGSEEKAAEDSFLPGEGMGGDYRSSRKDSGSTNGFLRFLQGIGLLVFMILLSLALTFAHSLWREYSEKESREGKEVTVEIPKGSSVKKMAVILQKAGVIRYRTPFIVRVYVKGYDGKLRYGTFELNDGMTISEVIRIMTTGGAQKKENSFIVPEGYSVEMIADKLEKEHVMTAQEFLTAVDKAAAGFEYAGELPDKKEVSYQLQGYLYPSTYPITDQMTGDELVEKMLETFVNEFGTDRLDQAKAFGMSLNEVLTRASMVQKETHKEEDYPVIAGVINNRLEKNMKLQFDSTVVYALSKGMYGVSRVTYDDLKYDSPYNTYQVQGLPPGPICNPDIKAIDGVLNPQKNKYLYFQEDKSKNDGSNLFFETYEEHSAAAAGTEDAPESATTEAQKKK